MSKTRRNGYSEGEFRDFNDKRIRGNARSKDKKSRRENNEKNWDNIDNQFDNNVVEDK
jgi:hypothetical protein